MANLTPLEQDIAKELLRAEKDGGFIRAPQAQYRLNLLKNQIVSGKPLDEKHPGMKNLTQN